LDPRESKLQDDGEYFGVLHILYSSSNIVRDFKSEMWWAGHIAKIGVIKGGFGWKT
jgi:hypothetical protein